MDAYLQPPMAWTFPEAAMDSDLTWTNEWNFMSSPSTPPNTYCMTAKRCCSCMETDFMVAFSPYEYTQLYFPDTNYLFNQAEPVASLPHQHSLNKTSPYASDRRDSCYNLRDAWTTSNTTSTGYSSDVAQPISTTAAMQGIYAASPSPTSQNFSNDQSFWSMQSPSSDQSLPRDHTPSPLSDDAGSPSRHTCSVPASSRTCYDHGCDGRVFSSRSNLLRHQRERTPNARLLACPMCGATFYRVWTRDYHVKSARCQKLWHRQQRQQRLRLQGDYVATSRERLRHSYFPAV